jgi:16S rRNA (adenine1518-N6/adenine1519-N6)-dimethyltransferase
MTTSDETDRGVGEIPDPRRLLAQFGLRPRKGLGQHFLVDRRYLGQILAAADLGPDDTVLEIGPGLGVLTNALAERAARVVAVEIDAAMCRVLEATVGDRANVSIVTADILSMDPPQLVDVDRPGAAAYQATR